MTSKRYRIVIVLCSLLLTHPFPVQGGGPVATFTVDETSTRREKVVDIDHGTRKVTLKDEKGNVRTITVAENVSNLGRVGTGDEETMNIGQESQTSPLPGEKPKGIRTIEGKLKTRVASIDYDARTITFKNRKSVMTTYKVGPEVAGFNEIRRGDMLGVDYAETLTLSVK